MFPHCNDRPKFRDGRRNLFYTGYRLPDGNDFQQGMLVMYFTRALACFLLGVMLLAGLGSPSPAQAEEPSLEQLLDDLNNGTAEVALRAIQSVQRRPRDPQQVIPKLIELLDDDRQVPAEFVPWRIEQQAMFALLGYGKEGVPFLTRQIQQGDGDARSQVLWILEHLGQPIATSAAASIADAFHAEEDEWKRERLLEVYSKLEDDPAKLELVVRKALADESAQVFAEGLRIAGEHRLAHPEIIERLTEAVDDDRAYWVAYTHHSAGQEYTRPLAIKSLGRIGPAASAAEEKIRPHLAPDKWKPGLHLTAAFAIYRMTDGDDEMLQLLIAEAKNTEPRSASSTAIRLLGEIGAPAKAIWPLLLDEAKLPTAEEDDLEGEGHDDYAKNARRHLAFKAAVQIGEEDAVPLVRQALTSARKSDRQAAAEALAEQGPSAAQYIPQLIEALHDERGFIPDFAVIATANALGAIGPQAEAAIEPLQNIADTEHEGWELQIKTAAVTALAKIRKK